MKNIYKLSIGTIALGAIVGVALTVASPKSPYTKQLTSLQNELSVVNNQSNRLTIQAKKLNKAPSTKTVLQSTTYNMASSKASDLMTKMYTWQSGKTYTANRNNIIQNDVSSEDVLEKIMPVDKDNSGNSQVDALNLKSSLKSVKTFASDLDNEDLYIVATISASNNDSTDDSTLTNNQVYQAHFDTKSQKFTSLNYIGKESLDNSTGADSSN